ncbi:MAG: AAA family ATPase [Myxococcota bacterium]
MASKGFVAEPSSILDTSERVRRAVTEASRGLVGRDVLAELIALSAVAGEHLLVIGPPGTAKSEVVRRVARSLGGNYFEYLLGRFTEPSEIFGPVDLRKLREGVVVTETSGMLPEAEIAFLDEVFLGSTAILNTLLAILNERVFRRGHTKEEVPLRVCVGASNALPEDEGLAAFADRFLARVYVDAVADHDLETLLEGGWSLRSVREDPLATIQDLDLLAKAARSVDLGPARPEIASAVRALRGAGIALSDRRAVKLQRLVAAAAVMDGRTEASLADLWPIIYAVPREEEQVEARSILKKQLEMAQNRALSAAAEDASLGMRARADRLVRAGDELLKSPPEGDRWAYWLKLEGVVREIDACFMQGTRPEAVSAVRDRIVAELGARPSPAVPSARRTDPPHARS